MLGSCISATAKTCVYPYAVFSFPGKSYSFLFDLPYINLPLWISSLRPCALLAKRPEAASSSRISEPYLSLRQQVWRPSCSSIRYRETATMLARVRLRPLTSSVFVGSLTFCIKEAHSSRPIRRRYPRRSGMATTVSPSSVGSFSLLYVTESL